MLAGGAELGLASHMVNLFAHLAEGGIDPRPLGFSVLGDGMLNHHPRLVEDRDAPRHSRDQLQSADPLRAALFSLGLSLAAYKIKGQAATLSLIVLVKLLIYPAVAYALAVWVFDLPPLWTSILLLFAAMPVGANAYLFAIRYDRAVNSVSASIAVSTLLAVMTVAALLYVLKFHAA